MTTYLFYLSFFATKVYANNQEQPDTVVSNTDAEPTNVEPAPEIKSNWNLALVLVIVIIIDAAILGAAKGLDILYGRYKKWAKMRAFQKALK